MEDIPQSGLLDNSEAEAGIFCSTFEMRGMRAVEYGWLRQDEKGGTSFA